MPTKFDFPQPPVLGIEPQTVFRNGTVADGLAVGRLVAYHDAILQRRLRTLAKVAGPIGSPIGYTATKTHGYFKTSTGCGDVFALIAYGPTDGSSATPWAQVTMGGVAQPKVYTSSDNSGSKSIDDFSEVRHTYQRMVDANGDALAGDTAYQWSVETSGTAFIGFQITFFEVPKSSLTASVDALAVDPAQFGVSAPVLDVGLNQLVEGAWTLYARGGSPYVDWSWITADLSFGSGTSEPVATGTSWLRVADGGSSTFSSSALGHPYWAYRNHSAVTTTVNCTFWAIMKTTSGGTAECRFENSAGVQATVTTTSTTYALATATGTVSGTSTSDMFVVSHRNNTALKDTTTIAYGVFPDD